MTKQQIIDTIKAAEGKAWLELAKYDLEHKPVVTTWEQECEYAQNDVGHRTKLDVWYALKLLMNELGITADFDALHQEAGSIIHEIFTREQNARGIYYDEWGQQNNLTHEHKNEEDN